MKVSVIVTTYNKERELSLVLEAYRHQIYQDFEIVVADDGSGPATREVIENARKNLKVQVKHSWQEDDGFRAARSRNLAIHQCDGEIIAMTDGDCLPMPDYVSQIAQSFEASSYRAGERFLLTEQEAAEIEPQKIATGGAEYLKSQVPARERKRVQKIARKNRWYRLLRLKERPKVMTCNFVAWRSDLERVNGFDERYVGWGHEDTDLGRRLRKLDIRSKENLSPGEMIHLWHKSDSSFAGRVRDCPNADYFNRGFFLAKCRDGLKKREWHDFNLYLSGSVPKEFQSSSPENSKKQPEIEILWGATASDQFQANAEIAIYLLQGDAKISKRALNKAHLLFVSSNYQGQIPESCKARKYSFESVLDEKTSLALQQQILQIV